MPASSSKASSASLIVLAAQCVLWIKHVLPAAPPLAISFFTFEFATTSTTSARGGCDRKPHGLCIVCHFFSITRRRPHQTLRGLSAVPAPRCRRRGSGGCRRGTRAGGDWLWQKVVISDNLAQVINYYGPHFTEQPLGTRWLLFAAIAFRILLDFSGYSDIAIGLARMFGITLPENFRWPYLAQNLQEFWQRWHISLSTWIRDYIYIPLGGSRHGMTRKNHQRIHRFCALRAMARRRMEFHPVGSFPRGWPRDLRQLSSALGALWGQCRHVFDRLPSAFLGDHDLLCLARLAALLLSHASGLENAGALFSR